MKDKSRQTPAEIPPKNLKPGLYIVATPIGNLGDITFRALETLRSVSLIACEDTRVTGKLLRHFGIATRMEPYHDHNAERKRPELLAAAATGPVALVSDAGTPLISDPGYKLVREAIEAGVRVEPIPGACSPIAALSASGLPTDRFLFEGFLPAKDTAARRALEALVPLRATLVFFESAKRVADTLALMAEIFGTREAAVMREITKLYEEAVRGTLPELAAHYAKASTPKGEIVIVVGPPGEVVVDESSIDARLKKAMKTLSLKDAAKEVAEALNLPRAKVYKRALELKDKQ